MVSVATNTTLLINPDSLAIYCDTLSDWKPVITVIIKLKFMSTLRVKAQAQSSRNQETCKQDADNDRLTWICPPGFNRPLYLGQSPFLPLRLMKSQGVRPDRSLWHPSGLNKSIPKPDCPSPVCWHWRLNATVKSRETLSFLPLLRLQKPQIINGSFSSISPSYCKIFIKLQSIKS